MIQEVQSLLINDTQARDLILFPRDYTVRSLTPVCARIRNAILGGGRTSLEYKCNVAKELVRGMYRDPLMRGALSYFDPRYIEPPPQKNEQFSYYKILSGDKSSILVDISSVKPGSGSQSVVLDVSTENGFQIPSQSWQDAGHGVRVMFKNQPLDGYTIEVFIGHSFEEEAAMGDLQSIQGLHDAFFLAGERVPECTYFLKNFSNDTTRFIFSSIVVYAVLSR